MSENRKPLLQVEDINVYYGAIHAIKGISFEVYPDEIVTLIGARSPRASEPAKTSESAEPSVLTVAVLAAGAVLTLLHDLIVGLLYLFKFFFYRIFVGIVDIGIRMVHAA